MGTTHPRVVKCETCGQSFVARTGNVRHCPDHRKEAKVRQKLEHIRRAAIEGLGNMTGNNPCYDCSFLRDCRNLVKNNRDPHCFVSHPLYKQFVGLEGER